MRNMKTSENSPHPSKLPRPVFDTPMSFPSGSISKAGTSSLRGMPNKIRKYTRSLTDLMKEA